MLKELSKMTQSELATIAIPVIRNFRCECCGSTDLAHDVEMCEQSAYVRFDAWRTEEMKRGRWFVAEYSDQDLSDRELAEILGEEWNAPDITDEMMIPHMVCPSMGLY
jgi:ribosomal protein L32